MGERGEDCAGAIDQFLLRFLELDLVGLEVCENLSAPERTVFSLQRLKQLLWRKRESGTDSLRSQDTAAMRHTLARWSL